MLIYTFVSSTIIGKQIRFSPRLLLFFFKEIVCFLKFISFSGMATTHKGCLRRLLLNLRLPYDDNFRGAKKEDFQP